MIFLFISVDLICNDQKPWNFDSLKTRKHYHLSHLLHLVQDTNDEL